MSAKVTTLTRETSAATVLDRNGQQAFWDRQAADYDQADMTRDNEGELDHVRTLCRQFCESGCVAEDVVTLGGAVGSRDPKVVLEVLGSHSRLPVDICFNDLSEVMAKRASTLALASYAAAGVRVTSLPGPIHEICHRIRSLPRRVIIGAYRLQAFTSANPHYGYPLSGFEEYVRNADKIGTHLTIEPVHLAENGYVDLNTRVSFRCTDTPEKRASAHAILADCSGIPAVDAIRVIGRHPGKAGYFLSHWYTEHGIRRLMFRCFGSARISSMSLVTCAKGFVVCLDPVERPRGIVTMLNNVIGNILPGDQMETLRAIDALTR